MTSLYAHKRIQKVGNSTKLWSLSISYLRFFHTLFSISSHTLLLSCSLVLSVCCSFYFAHSTVYISSFTDTLETFHLFRHQYGIPSMYTCICCRTLWQTSNVSFVCHLLKYFNWSSLIPNAKYLNDIRAFFYTSKYIKFVDNETDWSGDIILLFSFTIQQKEYCQNLP